jgi:photoactive yellow protein
MAAGTRPSFDDPDILATIHDLSVENLDTLTFGVIGFDAAGLVKRYNRFESEMAGLSVARVMNTALFTLVGPCMNNYLVAQRFEDAVSDGTALDATIDYVFTLRMRPVKVQLRLLASPHVVLRYVLVNRHL